MTTWIAHGFSRIAPALAAVLITLPAMARETTEAEKGAWEMARKLEKEGFAFRAESWQKELRPDMGKAVKVQLFKGLEYRFCIAVTPGSGVSITAAVLDFDGKPMGDIRPIENGWGVVLEFKPKRTGVYAIAIRQHDTGSAGKAVNCAMLTGYK